MNEYAPRHHSIRITAVLIKCTQRRANEEYERAKERARERPQWYQNAQLHHYIRIYSLRYNFFYSDSNSIAIHCIAIVVCAVAALWRPMQLWRRMRPLITWTCVLLSDAYPVNLKTMLELENPHRSPITTATEKDSEPLCTMDFVHQSNQTGFLFKSEKRRRKIPFCIHNMNELLLIHNQSMLFAICRVRHHRIIIIIIITILLLCLNATDSSLDQ